MVAFSRGLLKFTLFAAAVAVVGQRAFVKYYDARWEYRATERVRMMLERLRPGADRGVAACLWSRGSLTIPDGDPMRALEAMDEWARKAGFETVADFEILGARLEAEPKPLEEPVVVVEVSINGRPRRMRVVQGLAIAWLN